MEKGGEGGQVHKEVKKKRVWRSEIWGRENLMSYTDMLGEISQGHTAISLLIVT